MVRDTYLTFYSMNVQNSHAICDIGLEIMKQLVQKDVDLQELSHLVSLPPTLYKASEKKEGDGTMVCSFIAKFCSSFRYAKYSSSFCSKFLTKSFSFLNKIPFIKMRLNHSIAAACIILPLICYLYLML